jgi:hypothetical protein
MATAPSAFAQTAKLSGYIREKSNNELVRYAIVTADGDTVRAQSNVDGFYYLNLTKGVHSVRVRALGFAPLDTQLTITAATVHDLFLVRADVQLKRIDVQADRKKADVDPASSEMSVSRLNLDIIRKAPAVLGEVDPLRSITLLPGVSRSSDASTAFSVRGGSNDQNLILLDGATVYNPAHVLGFLSVFNADAIADMTLYKGAIPAQFGGRLSSVLDVRQREGNANEFAGSASVGLLASRVLFEGPLPKHKGSFLIAARRSYADLFLRFAPDTTVRDARAFFYDVNAKATYPLGSNGTLMASGYVGRDLFSPSSEFAAGWGNAAATVRWDQIIATRLFSRLSYSASKYDYRLAFTLLNGKADWRSNIQSNTLHLDESLHFTDRSSLDFGAEISGQSIHPGDLVSSNSSNALSVHVSTRNGQTSALYANHTLDITPRLSLQYGARYSQFARRGPATIYHYANNLPVVWDEALQRYQPGVLRDSTKYQSGSFVTFGGLEPRASMRFGLTNNSSIKASFARTRQYLLLVTRTNSPTPLDVWEPVGPYVKPQLADQVALGYSATLHDDGYEFSAETYFKRLYNVLDFVDGSDIILTPRIETALLHGVGRAYGLELYLNRKVGSVTGWVSYTLSRTEQRFIAGPSEGVNNGNWFLSPTDKLHNLSIVAVKPIWTRWVLGSTFAAASGLPATFPVSRYAYAGFIVPEYGPRNSSRLPFYHRLDLSLTRTGNRGELQFGVYNAYNHFNAQSISFRQNADNPLQTEAVQLSIFGIVPSISYTFRF